MEAELDSLRKELRTVERAHSDLEQKLRRGDFTEGLGGGSSTMNVKTIDVGSVEWTIPKVSEEMKNMARGESIWSPIFSVRGFGGVQLEFFPCGRETTQVDGVCSVFLWCPQGTVVRYQLGVGSYFRAPDKDFYDGRMGHGHSNFCYLPTEINADDDSVTVHCHVLDMYLNPQQEGGEPGRLLLRNGALYRQIESQVAVVRNQGVKRVEWRITDFARKRKHTPRGSSLHSPVFSVAGVDEILLEFYPNGSANSTKDGFCSYYLRCPDGTKVVVSLFVGGYKRGPIQAVFEGSAGKGLPDFCEIDPEIAQDDTVLVGLEISNANLERESHTLMLEDSKVLRYGQVVRMLAIGE